MRLEREDGTELFVQVLIPKLEIFNSVGKEESLMIFKHSTL